MNSMQIIFKIIILLLFQDSKSIKEKGIKPIHKNIDKNTYLYNRKLKILFYKTIYGFIKKNSKSYRQKKQNLSKLTFYKKYQLILRSKYIKLESTYSNNMPRYLNVMTNMCLKEDKISFKNFLCIECNSKEGYYPIYKDYKEKVNFSKYVECYRKEEKPINYYFNDELKAYERCYETCETCFGYGNINNNNCSSCLEGYIFQPEIVYSKNCVEKCKYYYYYTLTGDYSCTDNYRCPREASLLIEDLNKCVYDCKFENDYIFKYNGECLKKCPENTHPNEFNICIEKDIKNCYFTKKEIKLNGSFFDYNIINDMIKKYVEEFIYTDNHVSQFITQNYSILIYKNRTCLKQFLSNFTVFEFDECVYKINEKYNLSYPLILIFDRINKYGNPLSSIYFFHPSTGDKLNTSFCRSMYYNAYKNISQLSKNEFEEILIKFGVDIYNIESGFYNSLCNSYNKNFRKDIPLRDRILFYFPNISICEINCQYKGTNYQTNISNCICKYDDVNFTSINENNEKEDDNFQDFINLIIQAKSGINDVIEYSKVASLLCLKYSLYPKNFIVNIGGIFLLILFIIQILCIIILCKKKFIYKICRFINLVISLYIKNKKEKIIKQKKKYKKTKKVFNDYESNISINVEKIKKCNTSPRKEINESNNEDKINYEQKDTEIYLNDLVTNLSDEITDKSFKISDNYNIKEFNKYKDLKLKKKSVLEMKKTISVSNINKKDFFTEYDINEYLSKSPDDLDFYKALRRDKRSFWIFIINMIIKKNIIVQTFVKVEETKPFFLKIIQFIMYIKLYFFSNTFLLLVSDIVSLNEQKSFIFYAQLTIVKSVESIIINKIIKFYLDLFLTDKYTIKELIKLEKDDEKKLRVASLKLIKKTKIKYVIFIILNILISTLSFCFVCGFNFAYPNTKFYFFGICIFIVIFEQVITIGLVFLEACFRFLALKCKIKAFFLISQYINGFN